MLPTAARSNRLFTRMLTDGSHSRPGSSTWTIMRRGKSLQRMAEGNLSDVKSVGAGVLERRINWGPGYRVYFGRHGHHLVVLLAGGTKQQQGRDIEEAHSRWADYKRRRQLIQRGEA